jgi:hypothetical protein
VEERSRKGPARTKGGTLSVIERQAQEDFRELEKARQRGVRIPGVWLLEPMPGNHARLDRVFSMGLVGAEVEATTKVSFHPLINLQVWLHGRSRDSEWVQTMAARVSDANPEGLYIHWHGMQDRQSGSVVIRNAAYCRRPLYRAFADQGMERMGLALDPDLYDLVRITTSAPDLETATEQVKAAVKDLGVDASPDSLIQRATRMQRALRMMKILYPEKFGAEEQVPEEKVSRPPAQQGVHPGQGAPAAAPQKPWWED